MRKGLSEEEKRAHARALNLSRRHLTSAQKREIIEAQLKETPSISSRAIAARFGVHHSTVSAARDRLESTGEISQLDKTEGRDGRERRRPIKTQFLPDSANVKELHGTAKLLRDAKRAENRETRAALINEIAARGQHAVGELPRRPMPSALPIRHGSKRPGARCVGRTRA